MVFKQTGISVSTESIVEFVVSCPGPARSPPPPRHPNPTNADNSITQPCYKKMIYTDASFPIFVKDTSGKKVSVINKRRYSAHRALRSPSTPPTCAHSSTLTISPSTTGSSASWPIAASSTLWSTTFKSSSCQTVTSPCSGKGRPQWGGFSICWTRGSIKVGSWRHGPRPSWGGSGSMRLLWFTITPSRLSLRFISSCGMLICQ